MTCICYCAAKLNKYEGFSKCDCNKTFIWYVGDSIDAYKIYFILDNINLILYSDREINETCLKQSYHGNESYLIKIDAYMDLSFISNKIDIKSTLARLIKLNSLK